MYVYPSSIAISSRLFEICLDLSILSGLLITISVKIISSWILNVTFIRCKPTYRVICKIIAFTTFYIYGSRRYHQIACPIRIDVGIFTYGPFGNRPLQIVFLSVVINIYRRGVGLLLDETLEWNVAFPAMQIQNKFLKKIGPVTWRDEKAIHDITQKYIGELMIKCTSSLQKARELSGGNQQKICLAKAFALEPRFLFVSEPTRGIDVGAKALVLDALRRFNRESGVTVVMISSELEELRQTCDRIAIVSGGRIAGILPATDSSEAFGALMVSQVK